MAWKNRFIFALVLMSCGLQACSGGGGGSSAPPGGAAASGPAIQSIPPVATLVGTTLKYDVEAATPTPAALTFSLQVAPPGMTINSQTGLILWTPAVTQGGDHTVTLIARDSRGETRQEFTLSVFGKRQVASSVIARSTGGSLSVTDASSTINGLSVLIPPNALAGDTTITISELIMSPTVGGRRQLLSKGFIIEPDGLSLSVPATITLPYALNEFATDAGLPIEEFLGLSFLDPQVGFQYPVPDVSVDTTQHILTGTISHFSVYIEKDEAQLCPPVPPSNACPNVYTPSSPPVANFPLVLIHGFQLVNGGMGKENTWGELRRLLLEPYFTNRTETWRFDYDSRDISFTRSAMHLAKSISEITLRTEMPWVNVLAHSFGGIEIRTYIQNKAEGILYRGDVNKVMTLGTPHRGIGEGFLASLCNVFIKTCAETYTGGGGGDDILLNVLNGRALPDLSSTGEDYYVIAGRKWKSYPTELADSDGVIMLADADICGALASGCGGVRLTSETVPGLCHTDVGLWKFQVCGPGDIPMAEINDTHHPLWQTIVDYFSVPPSSVLVLNSSCTLVGDPSQPYAYEFTASGIARGSLEGDQVRAFLMFNPIGQTDNIVVPTCSSWNDPLGPPCSRGANDPDSTPWTLPPVRIPWIIYFPPPPDLDLGDPIGYIRVVGAVNPPGGLLGGLVCSRP